ncbi:hypothetical protein [Amycolatopsis sp. VC5-11]|uniref:hypothetical protein n=1 Tax=Amycolatopsis sp. VC5-11 TaxID=3120156 RepID=UPI0030084C9A
MASDQQTVIAQRIAAMQANQDQRAETLRRAAQPSAHQVQQRERDRGQLEARLAQLGYQRPQAEAVDLDSL